MYPNHYFNLFPPFPRNDKVFVAMDFSSKFHPRWENVIVPGIKGLEAEGIQLTPHRVDTNQISDSILTEILGGISDDRLVIADVTAQDVNGRTVRNENVMYEVGLAHAHRLPEEVILFRSDSATIPFDVANIRLNYYNPDSDPERARSQVSKAISEAIREIDLKRHMAVKNVAQSLDFLGWSILTQACDEGSVRHFETRTIATSLSNTPRNAATARLLELGALQTDWTIPTEENGEGEHHNAQPRTDDQFFSYKPTLLGVAVHEYCLAWFTTKALTGAILKKVITHGPEGASEGHLKPMSDP